MGWEKPTPVQSQTIPSIADKRDVWIEAPTGSGKTAAFALPILQNLASNEMDEFLESRSRRFVSVLVLSPTRELTIQTKDVMTKIHEASNMGQTERGKTELSIRAVYGGVSINPQLTSLQSGSDVLVATPGRLLDVVKNNGCDLSSVRFLVLDEADKMLSPGFVDEVEKVISLIPAGCQKAVFSATFPFKVRPKVHKMLREGYVKVGGEQAEDAEAQGEDSPVPDITHRALLVDEGKRASLLKKLIEDSKYSRLLVFANTKYDCEVRTERKVKRECRCRRTNPTH
jgi:ATP-dependent RNA helicase RhlE